MINGKHRFRMHQLTVGGLAVLALALLSVQCSDDRNAFTPSNTSPASLAPVACFTMEIVARDDPGCSFPPHFVLDPQCSTDDSTATADLEVRWDFDNDGTWDTDFQKLDTTEITYALLTDTLWIASCEIRDSDGLVTMATDSLALSGLPSAPDLIAVAILFDTTGPDDGLYTTSVRLGQTFSVELRTSFLGDFSQPDFRIDVFCIGNPFHTSTTGFSSSTGYGCGGTSFGGNVLYLEGFYDFSANWDATEVYSETDETNNTAGATLTVIP